MVGGAGGVAWVVSLWPWWCCVQGSRAVPCFLLPEPQKWLLVCGLFFFWLHPGQGWKLYHSSDDAGPLTTKAKKEFLQNVSYFYTRDGGEELGR